MLIRQPLKQPHCWLVLPSIASLTLTLRNSSELLFHWLGWIGPSLATFSNTYFGKNWQGLKYHISYGTQKCQMMGRSCWSLIHFGFHYHAAATAKSLQSCPTLCDRIDVSPPGSPAPGILQARTLEWVAISFSNFHYHSTQPT